jgi:ribosomal subunit interface protein
MKLEVVTANNIEVTPEIDEYLRARVDKLSKLVTKMPSASLQAEIGQPKSPYRKGAEIFYAEFKVSLPGNEFTTHKEASNIYKAIESARNETHRRIVTWKKRQRTEQRKNGAIRKQFLRSGGESE